MWTDEDVAARVSRLEIPFSQYGFDAYGIEKSSLSRFFKILGFAYHRYFRVRVTGIEHVPLRGRAMLVGNHSGGVALDAAIVIGSAFFEMEPPRLAQGMAERFLNRFPFASRVTNRLGQFTGLPEHAARLLEDGRLLLVFPEGARGTAKLFAERDSLVRFGTGFMRLALKTRTPIVPFGFVGGGEAIPTVKNLYGLGHLVGVPYIPLTAYLLPLPLPVLLEVVYGEPMAFEGTGEEPDDVIEHFVEAVKSRVASLVTEGRKLREQRSFAVERGAS